MPIVLKSHNNDPPSLTTRFQPYSGRAESSRSVSRWKWRGGAWSQARRCPFSEKKQKQKKQNKKKNKTKKKTNKSLILWSSGFLLSLFITFFFSISIVIDIFILFYCLTDKINN